MRYKKISITNHPLLGTVTFDFVNPNTGSIFQNVVLAGENGIGKTVFLQLLNTFSLEKKIRDVGIIHLEVEVSDDDITRLINKSHEKYGDKFSEGDFPDHLLIIDYDSTNTDATNWGIGKYVNAAGQQKSLQGYFFSPLFRSIFSRAEIVFSPKHISSVTALELDSHEMAQEQSSENLSTEIKQLLVDINSQDAIDCQEWVDNNPGVAPTDDVKHMRLRRFTNAFDRMFPEKRIKKVSSQKGSIDVIFEANGKTMSIDNLSSGEKEIVFRGAFMLKDKHKVSGSIALVDEPELSMHPKWEMKILDYYRDLFRDENNNQMCQLFFATHSVYVLKRALESNDDSLVIVLNKDDAGNIVSKPITAPNKLKTITGGETSYLAFGIYTVDYHIELFSEYQSRNSLKRIKDVDISIMTSPQYLSNPAKYHRHSEHRKDDGSLVCSYDTVCCLVRNHIDHPNTSSAYTDEDLIYSTELLRSLL